MNWRSIAGTSSIMALALATSLGSAVAQPAGGPPAAAAPKPLKDQLVGSWTLLLADTVKADHTQSGAYGPNPIGSIIFAPDGHYSMQIMRSNQPRNPMTEFGTFVANDGNKTLTLRVRDSSDAAQEAKQQNELVTAVTPDVLTWSSVVPVGAPSHMELAWQKAK